MDLTSPSTNYIKPIDIAYGLGMNCRFGGHTKKFYSIAEHSWLTMELAERNGHKDPRLLLDLLLHDAHEAFMTDLPSPFKDVMPAEFQFAWEGMKDRIQGAIDKQFAVKYDHRHELIKKWDRLALEVEWENKVLNWRGLALDPDTSAEIWLEHFKELTKILDLPSVIL